jgi:phage baseplate assembly protein W
MAIISFKDVGTKAFQAGTLQSSGSQIPYGIKTPMEIDDSEGNVFKMHYRLADQIEDNLRNLILTNHGERIVQTFLGANLRPLLTEFSNKDDFDTEAMLRINTAISKWMPFVSPIGFESVPDYEDNIFTGHIRIFMVYSVPALNVKERSFEVNLYVL